MDNLLAEIKTLLSTPLQEVDLEHLDDVVFRLSHHAELDEDPVAEALLGDVEVFSEKAQLAQEAEELEWEVAVNNPDHPRHAEVWKELNS